MTRIPVEDAEDGCGDLPERRDSTRLRRESHSKLVHPSRLKCSSLGQIHGCEAGGVDKFYIARLAWLKTKTTNTYLEEETRHVLDVN